MHVISLQTIWQIVFLCRASLRIKCLEHEITENKKMVFAEIIITSKLILNSVFASPTASV